MLNKQIRILNFDDSVTSQRKLCSEYETDIVHLKDIGPGARFWMDKRSEMEIRNRIRGSAKNSVTFLGSGDFHQVSGILIEEIKEPVSVIHFDFHPDWNIFPPRASCGGWVTRALKNRNVLKHVIIGVCSTRPSSFSVQTGNFGSLENDRVEIYPYAQVPSVVFLRKIPANTSVNVRKGLFFKKIRWNALEGKNLKNVFLGIIKKIPPGRVYVSIDKDCLKKEWAATNWQEGKIPLKELLLMVRLIKENLDITGADITGDYSPIIVKGIFKKIISRLNHPEVFSAKGLSDPEITAINEEANLKILELLNS